MKLLDVLSSPEKWTKGTFAKRADGEDAVPTGHYAECFCLLGAVCKARNVRDPHGSPEVDKLAASISKLYPSRAESNTLDGPYAAVFRFNDNKNTVFEDVVAVIKDAGL